MAESYRLKDFHTNKSSTISKKGPPHIPMEETMWIPIEAVKYVDDDTRRLSKDVSRYFRYEAHREKYGAENCRTARALLTDAYKHKIGVSKTWREDQIKCDSGGARSARKCSVHTCNPRAQWTSRVGPHILHIEEDTVHVDFSCPRRRSAHNCR